VGVKPAADSDVIAASADVRSGNNPVTASTGGDWGNIVIASCAIRLSAA